MISIIIPAFNEERNIGKLIAYLKEVTDPGSIELIVVDGGSTDQTVPEAEEAGAKLLISPSKGRASQMNYGARHAEGNLLYFLHADTKPPKSFISDISRELNNGSQCGCFRLKFDSDRKLLACYAWFTRFNVDPFRFGDQSLFVTRALFEKTRGFDERLMVMEDQEIVKRLKEHAPFTIIPKSVITSARKYEEIGVFKLQLIFTCILSMYYTGVSQQVLFHFYKNILRTDFMNGEDN